MNQHTMIEIENLSHAYRTRKALENISFSVKRGEIFGLLGPNGSGKTTLFRILATSFPPASGRIRIDEKDLSRDYDLIRRKIGVVFQFPSLDGKLTVLENLKHQGRLYGISGPLLKSRSEEMLKRLGLGERISDRVEKLSGGLKRRVELAKAFLHRPVILILDEPSTGLDPGARMDLWKYLNNLRDKDGVTVLVTTHLMEEAEHCDRLAILNGGELVSVGTPDALKREVGGDVLHVKTSDAIDLAAEIKKKFADAKVIVIEGELQIEHQEAHRFIKDLVEAFPGKIEAITYRKPTLEDVFIHKTGHRFWNE